MGIIKVLPPNLVNLIAAGEVIERPAAVVKELLENAIDANANFIKVEIRKGGKELIKVEDNGIGILAEDLSLAVKRHTTSKINSEEDLFQIHTLGFRGEALASIAAVSHLRLASRPKTQLWGKEIFVVGGEIKEEKEIGMAVGTIAEVKELFFNTPARKKFLKKDSTEAAHIYETVIKLGLAYPKIHFCLKSEKRSLQLPSTTDLTERIGQIFGLDLAKSLKHIEVESGVVIIKGMMASLEFSRLTPQNMYFFVNGRWVKNVLLNQIVYKVLESSWPKGRYPFLVIFITLPKDMVDVNVHPTKQEIRFKDPHSIQEALEKALKKIMEERLFSFTSFESDIPISLEKSSFKIKEPEIAYEKAHLPDFTPSFRIIGQLWGSYIICETEEELILIDQHAAHERLIYEKIKQLYEEDRPQTQELLTPILLEISPTEIEIFEEILPHLEKMGFSLEPFGERTYLVRAVPGLLIKKDIRSLLEKVLTDLQFIRPLHLSEIVSELLKSMACHLAVRANDILSLKEMEYLIKEIKSLKILHCPHGRPFYKIFTKEEIKKFFYRS